MGLPEPFVLSMAIRNNYGIIGHLSLLQQFIGLLYDGEYIRHRDVPYYASRPATYWIDRFTLHEIANLLCQKELPLSEIAARMNFSSASYFSRYVQKHTGLYPTQYRKQFLK